MFNQNNQVNLKGVKVLVLGHTGMVGRALCPLLRDVYEADVETPATWSRNRIDLRIENEVATLFSTVEPTYVFNVCGYNGGIGFNATNPLDILLNNSRMNQNILECCHTYGVKKVVSLVASCAYPSGTWALHGLPEDKFFEGCPHDSVACHGYAKRHLQLLSKFFSEQHGLRAVCCCPPTLFGPHDSFDPQKTKVVGAMVKRFGDAVTQGKEEVVCWGTGRPLRELLYVEDAADLIVETMLHYEDSTIPLNISCGQEVDMNRLAHLVADQFHYHGKISWDKTKPDGQFRKNLDTRRMRSILPVFTPHSLRNGLRHTVAWYKEAYDVG